MSQSSCVTRNGSCGWWYDTTRKNGFSVSARAPLAQVLERAEVRLLVERQELRPRRDADARRDIAPRVPATNEATFWILRRHPVHACREDVSRQPAPEAVELVGPDEVHLAAEDGFVPCVREVVRERRLVGGEDRRVVPAAEVGGEATGE